MNAEADHTPAAAHMFQHWGQLKMDPSQVFTDAKFSLSALEGADGMLAGATQLTVPAGQGEGGR